MCDSHLPVCMSPACVYLTPLTHTRMALYPVCLLKPSAQHNRAGLEYLNTSGQQPHILHLHEWQTAAVSMLYWEVYSQLGLYRPRVVLTIHNLDNTGECRQDEFAYAGQWGAAVQGVCWGCGCCAGVC